MKKSKKAISLFTLFVFFFSQLSWAFPSQLSLGEALHETPGFLQIEIPADLATIEEIYEAPPKPTPQLILHVQNVHGVQEAQSQIKKLLEYLHEKYGFKLLFVEGAAEELNPDLVKFFSDDLRQKDFQERLLQSGELTGVDAYAMDAQNVAAVGIEQPELYRKNYKAFQRIQKNRKWVNEYLRRDDEKLDIFSSQVFSAEMRRILTEWQKFEKGHREFLPFAKGLADDARKYVGLDLESIFAQVEWPQMTRLLVLQAMESDLNLDAAKREKIQVIEFLNQKGMSKALVQAIEKLGEKKITVSRKGGNASQSELESNPRYLFENLVEEAAPKGFQFHDFPAFSLYAGYLILQSELESRMLFREIETLFKKILDEMADNQRQRDLLELYSDQDLIRKLFHLELTREKWQRVFYRRNWLEPKGMHQRIHIFESNPEGEYAPGMNIEEGEASVADINQERAETIFKLGLDFYQIASQRETIFFEKIQKEMGERQTDKAILVTGGFHTDGLIDLLREREINYGVLMPRLHQAIEGSDKYISTMLQENPTIFDLAQLEQMIGPQSAQTLTAQGMVMRLHVQAWLHQYMATIQAHQEIADTPTAIVNRFNQTAFAADRKARLELRPDGQSAYLILNDVKVTHNGETDGKVVVISFSDTGNIHAEIESNDEKPAQLPPSSSETTNDASATPKMMQSTNRSEVRSPEPNLIYDVLSLLRESIRGEEKYAIPAAVAIGLGAISAIKMFIRTRTVIWHMNKMKQIQAKIVESSENATRWKMHWILSVANRYYAAKQTVWQQQQQIRMWPISVELENQALAFESASNAMDAFLAAVTEIAQKVSRVDLMPDMNFNKAWLSSVFATLSTVDNPDLQTQAQATLLAISESSGSRFVRAQAKAAYDILTQRSEMRQSDNPYESPRDMYHPFDYDMQIDQKIDALVDLLRTNIPPEWYQWRQKRKWKQAREVQNQLIEHVAREMQTQFRPGMSVDDYLNIFTKTLFDWAYWYQSEGSKHHNLPAIRLPEKFPPSGLPTVTVNRNSQGGATIYLFDVKASVSGFGSSLTIASSQNENAKPTSTIQQNSLTPEVLRNETIQKQSIPTAEAQFFTNWVANYIETHAQRSEMRDDQSRDQIVAKFADRLLNLRESLARLGQVILRLEQGNKDEAAIAAVQPILDDIGTQLASARKELRNQGTRKELGRGSAKRFAMTEEYQNEEEATLDALESEYISLGQRFDKAKAVAPTDRSELRDEADDAVVISLSGTDFYSDEVDKALAIYQAIHEDMIENQGFEVPNEFNDDTRFMAHLIDLAEWSYVIEVEDEIAGFVLNNPESPAGQQYLEVELMGIHPDFRGRGLASRLLDASEELARELGKTGLWLEVDVDNLPAVSLYESLGFVRQIEQADDDYAEPQEGYVAMVKTLSRGELTAARSEMRANDLPSIEELRAQINSPDLTAFAAHFESYNREQIIALLGMIEAILKDQVLTMQQAMKIEKILNDAGIRKTFPNDDKVNDARQRVRRVISSAEDLPEVAEDISRIQLPSSELDQLEDLLPVEFSQKFNALTFRDKGYAVERLYASTQPFVTQVLQDTDFLQDSHNALIDNLQHDQAPDYATLLGDIDSLAIYLGISPGDSRIKFYERALFSDDILQRRIGAAFFSGFYQADVSDSPQMIQRLNEIVETADIDPDTRGYALEVLRNNTLSDAFDFIERQVQQSASAPFPILPAANFEHNDILLTALTDNPDIRHKLLFHNSFIIVADTLQESHIIVQNQLADVDLLAALHFARLVEQISGEKLTVSEAQERFYRIAEQIASRSEMRADHQIFSAVGLEGPVENTRVIIFQFEENKKIINGTLHQNDLGEWELDYLTIELESTSTSTTYDFNDALERSQAISIIESLIENPAVRYELTKHQQFWQGLLDLLPTELQEKAAEVNLGEFDEKDLSRIFDSLLEYLKAMPEVERAARSALKAQRPMKSFLAGVFEASVITVAGRELNSSEREWIESRYFAYLLLTMTPPTLVETDWLNRILGLEVQSTSVEIMEGEEGDASRAISMNFGFDGDEYLNLTLFSDKPEIIFIDHNQAGKSAFFELPANQLASYIAQLETDPSILQELTDHAEDWKSYVNSGHFPATWITTIQNNLPRSEMRDFSWNIDTNQDFIIQKIQQEGADWQTMDPFLDLALQKLEESGDAFVHDSTRQILQTFHERWVKGESFSVDEAQRTISGLFGLVNPSQNRLADVSLRLIRIRLDLLTGRFDSALNEEADALLQMNDGIGQERLDDLLVSILISLLVADSNMFGHQNDLEGVHHPLSVWHFWSYAQKSIPLRLQYKFSREQKSLQFLLERVRVRINEFKKIFPDYARSEMRQTAEDEDYFERAYDDERVEQFMRIVYELEDQIDRAHPVMDELEYLISADKSGSVSNDQLLDIIRKSNLGSFRDYFAELIGDEDYTDFAAKIEELFVLLSDFRVEGATRSEMRPVTTSEIEAVQTLLTEFLMNPADSNVEAQLEDELLTLRANLSALIISKDTSHEVREQSKQQLDTVKKIRSEFSKLRQHRSLEVVTRSEMRISATETVAADVKPTIPAIDDPNAPKVALGRENLNRINQAPLALRVALLAMRFVAPTAEAAMINEIVTFERQEMVPQAVNDLTRAAAQQDATFMTQDVGGLTVVTSALLENLDDLALALAVQTKQYVRYVIVTGRENKNEMAAAAEELVEKVQKQIDKQGNAISNRFNIAIVEDNPAFVRRAIQKMNTEISSQMRLMDAGISIGDKLVIAFEGAAVAPYLDDTAFMGKIVKSSLPSADLSAARDLVNMRFAQLNGEVELLRAELVKQGMPPDVIVPSGNIYQINAEALGALAKLWNSMMAEIRVKSAA